MHLCCLLLHSLLRPPSAQFLLTQTRDSCQSMWGSTLSPKGRIWFSVANVGVGTLMGHQGALCGKLFSKKGAGGQWRWGRGRDGAQPGKMVMSPLGPDGGGVGGWGHPPHPLPVCPAPHLLRRLVRFCKNRPLPPLSASVPYCMGPFQLHPKTCNSLGSRVCFTRAPCACCMYIVHACDLVFTCFSCTVAQQEAVGV